MISETVVNEFIRAWKQATFGDRPAWPSSSPIARIVEYLTRIDPSPLTSPEVLTDGEVLANIVKRMSEDDYQAYEAFIARHLAVIRGCREPKMKFTDRARAMGVSRDQFNRREKRGFVYCWRALDERLH